jgi:CRISPR-associated protein Cas2
MLSRSSETSFYVVSYDIPHDRRRTKIHDTLTGFGERAQYSVFECWLTKKEMLILRSKLTKLLDPKEDKLRIYNLCADCVGRVESVGAEKPKEKEAYLA